MNNEEKKTNNIEKDISQEKSAPNVTSEPLENFWPEESVQEILDYIEEQGIYIRE